ncbi:hypothetical protein LTR70_004908 [Exophiala xenobiotica]|nr:hypothetical protein LTR70_004908 [Exophiala xenobiotica]
MPSSRCAIPASFSKKKAQILSDISNHDSTDYSDKSPKGSIDSEIIELIDEINAFEAYVTTSSCAGRAAVFVEGRKAVASTSTSTAVATNGEGEARARETAGKTQIAPASNKATPTAAGPGGKGHGNKWLYVSHSPVPTSHLTSTDPAELYGLFQLQLMPGSPLAPIPTHAHPQHSPRLIKLSFSPLILHVLCANLHAAKGLLAAAINAGFRESGVQSLKALDDDGAGVMVGIRTAGLGFETVVGCVDGDGEETEKEVYRGLVDEGYLRMCVGVVNRRFGWNVERRERLRGELGVLKRRGGEERGWEDSGVRRERKREEGLRRRQERRGRGGLVVGQAGEEDVLEGGLTFDPT